MVKFIPKFYSKFLEIRILLNYSSKFKRKLNLSSPRIVFSKTLVAFSKYILGMSKEGLK